MPYRVTPLINLEYYHVFNRGVAKQNIFNVHNNYLRFERTIDYYQFSKHNFRFSKFLERKHHPDVIPIERSVEIPIKQVELIAYCLMPNHFHFLIKQVTENGISNFMRFIGNSYTRYFNTKYSRVGPIFQGPFKAIRITSESYLLNLSRYIHINPILANLISSKNYLNAYLYSSFNQYTVNRPSSTLVVQPNIILDIFHGNRLAYQKFCTNLTDYSETANFYKDIFIDENE